MKQVRERTEDKEIMLSGKLVMTKEAWEQRGGTYHGWLGQAARDEYFTVRECERMGLPVREAEFRSCKDFAMFGTCYADNCIDIGNGKKVRPCLPVFYRNKKDIRVKLKKRIDMYDSEGLFRGIKWSGPCDYTSLETAEYLMKAEPGKYKIAGYIRQKKEMRKFIEVTYQTCGVKYYLNVNHIVWFIAIGEKTSIKLYDGTRINVNESYAEIAAKIKAAEEE